MYNDPDGEWFHIVIGAIIGGFQGYKLGKAAGLKGWNLFWSTVGGAGIGALSAGAAASVAAGVSSAALATGATAFEASIASGMMAGIVSGAISGAGFTALGGGSFSNIMASAVQGAVIGGFSGAAGGAAFYGANQLLKGMPFSNTLSYISSSLSAKMTANTLTGENPFNLKWNDVFNLGAILPIAIDLGTFIPPLFQRVANKYLKENNPDFKVDRIGRVKTELQNGDLYFNAEARGEIPFIGEVTGKLPQPPKIQIVKYRGNWLPKIVVTPRPSVPFTIPFPSKLCVQVQLKHVLIYNYQSIIASLIIKYK